MLAVGPGDDRAVGELEGHEGTGPDRAGPTGVDGPEEPLASGSRGGSLGYGEGAVGGVVDTVEGGAQPRESIYCLYIYIISGGKTGYIHTFYWNNVSKKYSGRNEFDMKNQIGEPPFHYWAYRVSISALPANGRPTTAFYRIWAYCKAHINWACNRPINPN